MYLTLNVDGNNRPVEQKYCFIIFSYCLLAVSYTHLDVYKRQINCRAHSGLVREYDSCLDYTLWFKHTYAYVDAAACSRLSKRAFRFLFLFSFLFFLYIFSSFKSLIPSIFLFRYWQPNISLSDRATTGLQSFKFLLRKYFSLFHYNVFFL